MNRYARRRNLNLSKGLIILNILVGIMVVYMIVSLYTTSKNIVSTEEAIEEKKTVILELENELPLLEEELLELEQQVKLLEQLVVRHSPTLIPDSMK